MFPYIKMPFFVPFYLVLVLTFPKVAGISLMDVSFGTRRANPMGGMKHNTYRRCVPLALLALVVVWSRPGFAASDSGSEQADRKPKQEQKQSKAKDNGASLTGCIDEQNGHYLMIDERTRDAVADLQAEGFETEGFAKHVGHKVTVRGTSNPGEGRPLFKVRSIEAISDTCAPQSLSRVN